MHQMFSLIIAPSKKLGHVFIPYIITKSNTSDFYQLNQLVTEENYENLISKEERTTVKKLLTIIGYYEESNIYNIFGNKKQKAKTAKAFFETLDEELYAKRIRPYIETQLVLCLKIAIEHNIALYRREERANLYPEDRVKIATRNAEAVFLFDKLGDKLEYQLHIADGEESISLFNKHFVLISNDPCYIIIEEVLHHFPDIDGKKLKPFFDKESIQVPPSFIDKYFEGFILNCIKKFRVKAQGFAIEESKPTPAFQITIEKNLNNEPCLQLYCIYGDVAYPYSNRTKSATEYINGQYRYKKITRDLKKERDILGELISSGLQKDKYGFLLPQATTKISQWIAANKQILLQNNINIVTEKAKKVNLQQASITLQVTSKADWFDVDATVMFGEFRIPFKTIRKHIVKGMDQLALPDGSIAIIPEEWFAEYGNILMLGKDSGDTLKISPLHATFLPQKGIEYADKQTFAKLAELQGTDSAPPDLPLALNATLRPYQMHGYAWLYRLYKYNLGACLADDMGLGKTLQTLTLLAKVTEENANNQPKQPGTQLSLFDSEKSYSSQANLIVVPASLMHNWNAEICKFLPQSKTFQYYGNNRIEPATFGEYDFILITYGLLRNVIDTFENYEFLYVVLDESQAIKNPSSKIYKAVNKLNSPHKLVLTGTPIENNLQDLWSQMNFINHGMLGNQNFFQSTFIKPIEQKSEAEQNLLKQMISPFILRRMKQEVATDLPKITEQYVYCAMSESQANLYEEEKSKARNFIYNTIEEQGMGKSSIQILQAITALRQIANHPDLFDDTLLIDSGKFSTICTSLETILKENHKVLLFSSFVKHLELFKNYLEEQNIQHSMLTGNTSNRKAVVEEFQKNESCQVFLISLKAGGTGLNLTAADYVFMLDPWWNPAAEQQAISRAHRIGQTKPVFVYRFISENSIEEKIIQLQEKKAELADIFVNNNAATIQMEDLELILQ